MGGQSGGEVKEEEEEEVKREKRKEGKRRGDGEKRKSRSSGERRGEDEGRNGGGEGELLVTHQGLETKKPRTLPPLPSFLHPSIPDKHKFLFSEEARESRERGKKGEREREGGGGTTCVHGLVSLIIEV